MTNQSPATGSPRSPGRKQSGGARFRGARAGLGAAVVIVALALFRPGSAAAQSAPDRFELGVQLASAVSSEFDDTDVGVGGRFSWHPASLVGIEAELGLYPSNFPSQRAFSSGRTEGLFGVTIGQSFARVKPFVRLRPGFLSFREAPQALACILIFPPPISCTLGGRTVLAFDIGGGIEMFASGKTFFRADAGDRMLRYPGPVLDSVRTAHDGAFFSHDFRFAIGGGVRF